MKMADKHDDLKTINAEDPNEDMLITVDNKDENNGLSIQKLKRKSPSKEMECETEQQKVKPRRKSRLSLNPEVKGKEDLGQVSITSFFKKMSPKLDENGINSQDKGITNGDKKEDCLIGANNFKEVGKNNGIQNECEVDSDDCTFSKETRKKKPLKLLKEAMKLKKKVEKKTKNENEQEQVKENIKHKLLKKTKRATLKESSNTNESVEENTNKRNDFEEKLIDVTSTSNANQDSDSESKALDKKVRFSESIHEYSPEPLKKLSKSSKTDICNDEIKESHNSDGKTVEIIDDNIVAEVTSVENAAKIETKIENVFTFMMDSRNRSIGQNLIGKELEKPEEDNEVQQENKKKLSARKAIFQEWADIRGGKQKRLQDQEKDAIIKIKLKKRARRLKKMLIQNHSPEILNSDGKSNEEIRIKKHNVKPIIESDSECILGKEIVEMETSPKKGKRKKKVKDAEIVEIKNSPKKGKRKRKTKNAEVISKEGKDDAVVNEDSDAVDDELFSRSKKRKLVIVSDYSNDCNTNSEDRLSDPNLKNILNSPLHQTELSNFFGILNKDNSESGSKNKSKLQMKRNTKIKNGAKIDKRISKLTLKKNEDSNSSILISSDFSNSNTEIINHSSSEHNSMCIDVLNTTEIEVNNKNLNKNDIQNILTPRSFTKWKMRLKLNLEDIDDQEIEKLVQPCVDTNKNKKNAHKENTVSSDFDSDSSNEPLSSLRHSLKMSKGGKLNNIKSIKLAPLFIRAKPKSKKKKMDEETIEARRKFLHSEIPDSLKKTMKKQQPKLVIITLINVFL
ncbi:hypothetical protein ILUMI_02513 [Ignelater luminosus]|uniref:Uncharacterized protein n=1 Tax=Ignelater luminosus TaxID=2038154 RepID=A0A8K0GJ76_IGNLU|nr:hypothetical protein ILUMI_02513 [Ignelater luminosus]